MTEFAFFSSFSCPTYNYSLATENIHVYLKITTIIEKFHRSRRTVEIITLSVHPSVRPFVRHSFFRSFACIGSLNQPINASLSSFLAFLSPDP